MSISRHSTLAFFVDLVGVVYCFNMYAHTGVDGMIVTTGHLT